MVRTDQLGRVVQRLEADERSVLDAIEDALKDRVSPLRDASADALGELEARLLATYHVFLRALRGEDVSDRLDHHIASAGTYFALHGWPLHEGILGSQIAGRVVWAAAVDAAPPADRAEVIQAVSQIVLDILERMTHAFASAYEDAAGARRVDQEHDLGHVLEVLVGERPSDPTVKERGNRWGIDVANLRWCAAFEVPTDESGAAVTELRRSYPCGIAGRLHEMVIAYVPGEDPPDILQRSGVGLARLGDPRRAAQQARAAARACVRLGLRRAFYDDVMPIAVLLEVPEDERSSFLSATLGRLLDHPMAKELVQTLAAYFVSGDSPAQVGRSLHLHRHTVQYRLRTAARLVGADLRDPRDRLLLELATLLAETSERPGPTGEM